MSKHGTQPEGEHLRLAVRWLSENAPITKDTLEEASNRFDLSPLDEAFLFREFLQKDGMKDCS